MLRGIGAASEFRLLRHGLFPAGGGVIEVEVEIEPRPLQPLALDQRGALQGLAAEVMASQLPARIVQRERELDAVRRPAEEGKAAQGRPFLPCNIVWPQPANSTFSTRPWVSSVTT